jgi:hypothetical protein
MLVYRVANDGGQAVTVTHLGGAGKDTIGLMIPAFEPRRMEPGDYLLSMAEPNLLEAAESLHVIDSLGRKWRLNRRVFARLKKDWLAKAAGADGHASASMR